MWDVKKAWKAERPIAKFAVVSIFVLLTGALAMFGLMNVSRSWTEEVKLSDGSVIVVKRREVRERFGEIGSHGRVLKQEVDYDKSGVKVHWVGDIDPLIFDFANDKAYVVAYLSTGEECDRYGNPANRFLAYVYAEGTWRPTPMSTLPDGLSVNLLLNSGNSGGGLITLSIKHREDFNLPDWFKKFNKSLVRPCVSGTA